MKIQVYSDEKGWLARIFPVRGDYGIADIIDCKTLSDIDKKLARLHIRRSTPWEKVEWGYVANLRRKP